MALNVLIVDDSPVMREFVGRVLKLSGLELGGRFDAADGQEALQVMERQWIDLVLADINMPGMNGEELVREMRNSTHLRSLPVIILSTDGTRGRMERMLKLGVAGYLQKPFPPEKLRAEVDRVLGRRYA
jgi:two-component system, chemotaxis family, chemotaxis protein CheY